MKRTLPALVGSVAATVVLTACGGGADDTATDPAPAAIASTPAASPTTEPSAEPEMIGDYAAYPHDDYTYDLEVQCFCPYFGQPVTVTVAGGEVTDAVWAEEVARPREGRRGHRRVASPRDRRHPRGGRRPVVRQGRRAVARWRRPPRPGRDRQDEERHRRRDHLRDHERPACLVVEARLNEACSPPEAVGR